MAKVIDHIHLANKNHEALLHMLSDFNKHPEWVTTIAFYKSLQIVDAVCVELLKFCPAGHPERFEKLQRLADRKNEFPGARKLYHHFRSLHSASCIARYLSDKETKQHFSNFVSYLQPEDVIVELIQGRLIKIEQISIQLSPAIKQELLLTEQSALPTSSS